MRMIYFVLYLLLFISTSVFAQQWDYSVLEKHLGYSKYYRDNPYLNKAEKYAIRTYTNYDEPYYKDINDVLRDIPRPDGIYYIDFFDVLEISKDIDNAINKLPALPNDMILFRGVNLAYRDYIPHGNGDVFIDKAFFSTSVYDGVGTAFAGKGVMYAIYSSKKKRDGILCNPIEREVILPRSQAYKVMDTFKLEKNHVQLIQRCEDKDSCLEDIHLPSVNSWWDKYKQEKLNFN
jgi:hypothetical protein